MLWLFFLFSVLWLLLLQYDGWCRDKLWREAVTCSFIFRWLQSPAALESIGQTFWSALSSPDKLFTRIRSGYYGSACLESAMNGADGASSSQASIILWHCALAWQRIIFEEWCHSFSTNITSRLFALIFKRWLSLQNDTTKSKPIGWVSHFLTFQSWWSPSRCQTCWTAPTTPSPQASPQVSLVRLNRESEKKFGGTKSDQIFTFGSSWTLSSSGGGGRGGKPPKGSLGKRPAPRG